MFFFAHTKAEIFHAHIQGQPARQVTSKANQHKVFLNMRQRLLHVHRSCKNGRYIHHAIDKQTC